MSIAVVGVGGLGAALAHGLLRQGLAVALFDRHADKLAPFGGRATIAAHAHEAVRGADVVLLVVKPTDTPALLASLDQAIGTDTLVVSCAAGVPLSALPSPHALARAMPNVGAKALASTTGVLLGPRCVRDRDWPRVHQVFSAVGEVREVLDEDQLHAVTAVAASAPAFLLYAVEALVDAGVSAGLSRADSLAYAQGALRAAASRPEDPAEVRREITSPHGTTARGIRALEERGVRPAFLAAVLDAIARSRELAAASALPPRP